MAKPKNKPLKRFNGQGTVYKLPGRRRRPWVAQVTTGWEEREEKEPKRLYEIIGYFGERKDAIDALDKYRLDLNDPIEEKSTMTLGQVYEIYLKTKSKENLSKSTMDGIKASWKRLIKLENRPFCEIRSDEFQDIIDDWKADGSSKSSLTKLKSLIYALCEYAYHNGLLKTNYSTLIKVGEVDENEREAFTDFEVELFKKYAYKIDWVDTQLVLCYTGMRPVELLTLTKFNVDMVNRVITGGVKTDAGKDRIVPIHPLIFPIFQKWYSKNGETLFCDLDGKALTTRTYRENRFHPALEAINEAEIKEALKNSSGSEEVKARSVRLLTPYSCRHTFATKMNRVNAPAANVQKLIGHVVGSDTKDKVYTHPEIEDLRKTIEMLK